MKKDVDCFWKFGACQAGGMYCVVVELIVAKPAQNESAGFIRTPTVRFISLWGVKQKNT